MSNENQPIDQAFNPNAPPPRPVHFYQLPPSLRALLPDGMRTITHFGIAELSAMDEIDATEASGQSPFRLAIELTLRSFLAVKENGVTRRLRTHDGEREATYSKLHPKLRSLLQTAYAKVHGNNPEDTELFINAHSVEVM